MDKEQLFNDFPPITTEEWEALIQKDLKGADYEKKLVWKTNEGFKVNPYYRSEDLLPIDYLNSLPDKFPYTRGNKFANNDWEIVQEINEPQIGKANEIALNTVEKGATIVAFDSSMINSIQDMELLLDGLDLSKMGIQFRNSPDYVALANLFMQYIEKNQINKNQIRGGFDYDPITHYLKKERFYSSPEEDFTNIKVLFNLTQKLPAFKILNIHGIALHNAGATIVQELGYALSMGHEYLYYASENGLPIDEFATKISMTLSVGSNYFMEIAKLRAARLLWATIANQYHPKSDTSSRLYINSVGSTWNKTLYDPYVNMLRTTTEGMAASIGGADSISLKAFDIGFKKEDDFSSRISRNTQVILKEESGFNKVVDPSAGSYYIENLTNSIAESAWNLFKETEKENGIIALITAGKIKEAIEESCQKRNMDIATRRYILLGTNQYPNINEMMMDKMEDPTIDDSPGLKSYRGATAFEEIRLATEKHAKQHGRPKVFLLKVGNVAMRQARAGFATNFLGCAGYEILDNTGFASVDEALQTAEKAKPNIVVICSSDEEYATLGVEAVQKIKSQNRNTLVIIAGNPVDCIEPLKEAGADDFIHVRSNVLETLQRYNLQLTINN